MIVLLLLQLLVQFQWIVRWYAPKLVCKQQHHIIFIKFKLFVESFQENLYGALLKVLKIREITKMNTKLEIVRVRNKLSWVVVNG